jgi:hypothetical protein
VGLFEPWKQGKETQKRRIEMKECWTLTTVALLCLYWVSIGGFAVEQQQLRFGKNGEFKILQVADMHFANGKTTPCEDVLPSQAASCSDLNTTAFLRRMILAEKPHLIVFTGNFVFSLCCFVLPSDIELRLHTINYS